MKSQTYTSRCGKKRFLEINTNVNHKKTKNSFSLKDTTKNKQATIN